MLLILIVGGLLIMMGQHDRSEALFYYFRLEDHIPENHLLRLIDKHISFAFVREKLKASYSDTGRPSIDPELATVGSAQYILGPFGPDTDLRRYGLRLCERGGNKREEESELAVLLHRLWVSGEVYEPLDYASSRAIVQQAA